MTPQASGLRRGRIKAPGYCGSIAVKGSAIARLLAHQAACPSTPQQGPA